jgi:hypothetical protein
MTPEQIEAARTLLRIALRTEMPATDRALFMDSAAALLPDNEAEVAKHIGWLVRKCDASQADFFNALSGDTRTTSDEGPDLSPVK